MCGRYYIPEEDSAEELRAIIDEVNRKNKGAPIKKGEIRPTDVAPVLANNRAMIPSAFAMKWGYSLPDGKVVFNARSESASSRPMFQDGMAQRRCLVPAAYYFEWEKRGREKIKYAIICVGFQQQTLTTRCRSGRRFRLTKPTGRSSLDKWLSLLCSACQDPSHCLQPQ